MHVSQYIDMVKSCTLPEGGLPSSQDRGTSEELTQGIVAVALTGLIIAASTTILWRIFVVAWALVAAALRYSVVALFLILIAAFLT